VSDSDAGVWGDQTKPAAAHEPVLYEAVLGLLEYSGSAVVLDATVGHGGHAAALAGGLSEEGMLIGLDVDEASLAAATEKLAGAACRVTLRRENFGHFDEVLDDLGIGEVDVILADLGVSSAQLAEGERGFSFQVDGPLDMRLDDRLERTAADLVNDLSAEELADVIYQYGEERYSRRIARRIVAAREEKRIETTGELARVILGALGIKTKGRRSRIHPATRTFQALRIAVNDELGQLQRLLAKAPERLKVGGRIGVISFHSLEDRLVKHNFRENKTAGRYEILTRKPVTAEAAERERNPRSRSAKLRVARRIAAPAA